MEIYLAWVKILQKSFRWGLLILTHTVWAQSRLKSWEWRRFGSQHQGACALRLAKGRAGCWVRERLSPPAVRVRGYYLQKMFENSDAKSCILVTTCCEISCFLKTTAKKLGDQYIVCPQPKNLLGNQSPPVPTVVAPMCIAYMAFQYYVTMWGPFTSVRPSPGLGVWGGLRQLSVTFRRRE